MIKYGYTPDPKNNGLWEKDHDFTTQLKPYLAVKSGDIDLSKYSTPSNQYSLSSCAGNSTADAVEIVSYIDECDKAAAAGRAPIPVPQLSRLFVYSMARSIMEDDGSGHGQLDRDQGTYIRLCFDILSRFGICDEEIWPYDVSKVFVQPSVKALRQAVGHRIHSYYRIKESGNARVDAIVSALRGRHPVVFGTQLETAFESLKAPFVVNKPKGALIGGHAQVIVGWVNGYFKVKNSWGPDWADHGFSYFTPEYIAWDQTQDIWVWSIAVFNHDVLLFSSHLVFWPDIPQSDRSLELSQHISGSYQSRCSVFPYKIPRMFHLEHLWDQVYLNRKLGLLLRIQGRPSPSVRCVDTFVRKFQSQVLEQELLLESDKQTPKILNKGPDTSYNLR